MLTACKNVFSKSTGVANKCVAPMRLPSAFDPAAATPHVLRLVALKAALKIFFTWWEKLFFTSEPIDSLGKELKQAREKKELSIAQAAKKLRLPEYVIVLLEEGKCHDMISPSLLDPGYFRLVAVAYARLLDLDFRKIHPLLPPVASLSSAPFIKKLSPLQTKPRKPYFIREQQQLTYSLSDAMFFLWKLIKIAMVIAILLYLWGVVRHFMRVIF
jgi:transcriptional regulator with XRE-family HTH domain